MAKHRSKAKGSAAASAQKIKDAAEAVQEGEMTAEKPSYQVRGRFECNVST